MQIGWQYLRDADKDALFEALLHGRTPCPGPFHLELDPFDACNAHCYFCVSKEIRHGAVFPREPLFRLLRDARAGGLRSIRLSGGGEPTLYPHFIEILEWLIANDVRLVNLTTNGLSLGEPIAAALAQSPPSFLSLSLNYATPDAYARGMGLPPARFELVCENIARFNRLVRAAGRDRECQLHLQFMVNRHTLADLPAMFELAARLQAYGVTIRGIENLPAEERLTPPERQRFMEAVTPLAHQYKDRYWIMFALECEGLAAETAALGAAIHAGHDTGPAPDPALDAFRFCLFPWLSLAVLGSGRVYPCCILLNDSEIEPLGNLATQSLGEVWNGGAFRQLRRELRRSMLLGGPPPLARRLCRHSTAVCWSPGRCAVAASQPAPEDLARLAALVRELRRTPAGRATLLSYGLLRQGARLARRIAGRPRS